MKSFIQAAAQHLAETLKKKAPAAVAVPDLVEVAPKIDCSQMREILRVAQKPGQPKKRWFNSIDFDLSLWYDDTGAPIRMEFHYDVQRYTEKSLSWRVNGEYTHGPVENGYGAGRFHASSLVSTGKMPLQQAKLIDQFIAHAGALPEDVRAFVVERIRDYPNPEPEVRATRQAEHGLSPA